MQNKSAASVGADAAARETKKHDFVTSNYTRCQNSTILKQGKPAHQRATQMLGYALTLGNAETWHLASLIFEARLTALERIHAACAFLFSLDSGDVSDIAGQPFGEAGMPQTAFLSEMNQAMFWADLATVAERKAYALASYNRLDATDQAAFLEYVQGKFAS